MCSSHWLQHLHSLSRSHIKCSLHVPLECIPAWFGVGVFGFVWMGARAKEKSPLFSISRCCCCLAARTHKHRSPVVGLDPRHSVRVCHRPATRWHHIIVDMHRTWRSNNNSKAAPLESLLYCQIYRRFNKRSRRSPRRDTRWIQTLHDVVSLV